MAKSYRVLHHWNQWLKHFLGSQVIKAEKELLIPMLEKQYGKHTLLIGCPEQRALLDASVMPHHIMLGPLIDHSVTVKNIESDLHELPVMSGSIDLVILPHTLELIDNPHHLLTEACRIVKPEGFIIIFGFNPYSLWGLKKNLSRSNHIPWSSNFISSKKLEKWLGLSEFQLVKRDYFLFRPPSNQPSIFNKLRFLEWLRKPGCFPVGGSYIVMAQAKSIPLTPIKLRWKQQLSGFRASIPKPTIRTLANKRFL